MSDFLPYGHGFPQPTVKPHTCTTPTFGCMKCIEDNRTDWAKEIYDKWLLTYKFPKCKGCGLSTRSWGYSVTANGPLAVEVGCQNVNADEGFYFCSDHDFTVVIG